MKLKMYANKEDARVLSCNNMKASLPGFISDKTLFLSS